MTDGPSDKFTRIESRLIIYFLTPPAGGKIDPLRALREEDPALIAKEEMRQVQDYFQDAEAQLNKVKAQKNSFQSGVWNCGTVLLGNVGKVILPLELKRMI